MDKRQVYLNNAAGSFPSAPGVVEAVVRSMQEPPYSQGRGAFGTGVNALEECRRRVGLLLEAKNEEIVLCSGATAALNMAILGLGLRPGDLVITSVMEHNSVLRPLARLEKILPLRLEYIPLDAEGNLDLRVYEKLLREKPRLVALTGGSNVTGRINPVKVFFEKAKNAGAFTLLDAGQTAGHISLHPASLYTDMAAFSGYKGLAGPQGTGILSVASPVKLEPVFTGGTGVQSDNPFQPEEMPLRLEAGTPGTAGFAGLNEAVKYFMENENQIIQKENENTRALVEGLSSIKRIKILDNFFTADRQERLPVVSFIIEGLSVEEAGFMLTEGFGIQCRTGLHCAPLLHKALGYSDGSIRFSPSYMTPMEDINYALEAVRSIVHETDKS
ncbi:cysteine desulfurase [Spirochaetia bacterium]|nr:cysteine desulfurase [Spirochaetia bacterium]